MYIIALQKSLAVNLERPPLTVYTYIGYNLSMGGSMKFITMGVFLWDFWLQKRVVRERVD